MLDRVRGYMEFLPLILLTLLFVAEQEMESRALDVSCQIAITLLVVAIFFIITLTIKKGKIIAFIVAAIIWVSLVAIKRMYL